MYFCPSSRGHPAFADLAFTQIFTFPFSPSPLELLRWPVFGKKLIEASLWSIVRGWVKIGKVAAPTFGGALDNNMRL